jgi:hypothetical protein
MAGQRLTDKTALASNTASADNLMVVDTSDTTGSSAGTSKKVLAKYIIQTDKISLDNSEVIALDDGGTSGEYKELVGAPGVGYMIVPLQITIIATGAGATESSNKNLYIGYDNDQILAYYQYWSRFAGSLASGSVKSYVGNGTTTNGTGSNPLTLNNKPLYVWSNGTFNGGWAMDIWVTYQIVKM